MEQNEIIAPARSYGAKKHGIKPRATVKTWVVVLMTVTLPVWASLLIAAASVVLSLYIVLWALIVALWVVFIALVASALGCIAAGVLLATQGEFPAGLASAGAGLLCAGLAVFLFFGCRAATKGTAALVKKLILWIKPRFVRKEEAL